MLRSLVLRGAAGLMLLWGLTIYFTGPQLTFRALEENNQLVVHCSSLSDYGFGSYRFYSDPAAYQSGYDIVRGVLSEKDLSGDELADEDPYNEAVRDVAEQDRAVEALCDRARSERAGWIGLMAAPTSVLAMLGFRTRRPTSATASKPARTGFAPRGFFPKREEPHWLEKPPTT